MHQNCLVAVDIIGVIVSLFCCYCCQYEQGASGAIHGRLKYINHEVDGISEREQLTRPFRLIVKKSNVMVRYPLKDTEVSISKFV